MTDEPGRFDPGVDAVAAFDQQRAEALELIRHSEAFVLSTLTGEDVVFFSAGKLTPAETLALLEKTRDACSQACSELVDSALEMLRRSYDHTDPGDEDV